VARDEAHDIDLRRAATGLARACARPVQLPGVGVPGSVGWWGAAGLGPITEKEKRCTCQKLEKDGLRAVWDRP
jgi:hypothetical protein